MGSRAPSGVGGLALRKGRNEMKTCPRCGALAVLFADYEVNNTSGLGLRCHKRCGWQLSMQDVMKEYNRLRVVEQRIMDLDWCIGYELTEPLAIELDDIRSGCHAAEEAAIAAVVKERTELE